MSGTRRSRKQSTVKKQKRRGVDMHSKQVAGTIRRVAKATAKDINLTWDLLTNADRTYIKKKYFLKPSTSKNRKGR